MKKYRTGFICFLMLLAGLQIICMPAAAEEIYTTSAVALEARGEKSPLVWETALGDLCGDAVRSAAETDIALVPGGLLAQDIPQGKVSSEVLSSVFSEDREILVYTLSPAELRAVLEESVAHVVTGEDERIDDERSSYDGFMQISGFSFKYDASAKPGQRIKRITLTNGTVLDPDDSNTYMTAACPAELNTQYESTVTGQRLSNVLLSYAETHGGIEAPEGERISVVGNNPSLFHEHFSVWILVGIIILLVLIRLLFPKKFSYNDGLPE